MLEIGRVIRVRRLALGLTQESLAKQLDVSAPAVSKWEKALSYPDVTLLPRIARLLQIDVNQLLAFNATLTSEELRQFSAQLATTTGYAAYELAKAKLQDYPNEDRLRLMSNALLTVQKPKLTAAQWATVASFIEANYSHVMQGRDVQQAQQAAQSLFYFYLKEQRFTDAENQLLKLSDAVIAFNAMRPELYMQQGDIAKTYAAGEELLVQDADGIEHVLSILIQNALKDGQLAYAQECVRVGRGLADLVGSLSPLQADAELLVAKATQDRTQVVAVLSRLVAAVNEPHQAPLLAHRPQPEGEAPADKRQLIGQMLYQFVQEPTLKFAWSDPRLQQLLKDYGVNVDA